MNNLLKLSKTLIVLFCIFNCLALNAQISVLMSFNQNSAQGMPAGSGITPCEMINVIMTITNNTNSAFTGVIELEYPESLGFPSTGQCLSGDNMFDDLEQGIIGNTIFFEIDNLSELPIGDSYQICMKITVDCDDFIAMQSSQQTFNVTIEDQMWTFQPDWEIPTMLITDASGVQMIPPVGPSLNVDGTSSREYLLKVTDGVVKYFEFSMIYEDNAIELFDHYEVIYVTPSGSSATETIYTPSFNTSTLQIASIIPNLGGRMYENEYIWVREYFKVVACGDGAIASTFNLEWGCSSFNTCFVISAFQNVSVAPNNQGIQIQIYSDLTGTDFTLPDLHLFEMCNGPIDFGFQYSNPAPTGQFLTGSGHKWIDKLVIPIDWKWFYESESTFLDESIYLVWGTSSALLSDLQNQGVDVSYSGLNLEIDFSGLTAGIGPFSGIYGGDGFNGIAEGTTFNIEFRNAVFNCMGSDLQSGTTIGGFEDCDKGNFMPFGVQQSMFQVDFRDMCEVVTEQVSSYAAYHNNFGSGGTLSAFNNDTFDTDPVPSGIADLTSDVADVLLIWSVPISTSIDPVFSSPFEFHAGNPSNISLFDCGEVSYKSRLKIHPALSLNPGTIEIGGNPVDAGDIQQSTEVIVFEGEEMTFIVYEITHDDYTTNSELPLSAVFNFDPSEDNEGFCDVDPFWVTIAIFAEFYAVCDACTDCEFVLSCESVTLVGHCDEECWSGPLNTIGTDPHGFSLLRSTYGWTDNTMAVKAQPQDNLNRSRAYECDVFDVNIAGVVGRLPSSSTPPATTAFTELFVQIEYDLTLMNVAPTLYEFFDLLQGAFSFTDLDDNPVGLDVAIDPSADFQFMQGPAQECLLRIRLPQNSVADLNDYFNTPGSDDQLNVSFEGRLKVRLFQFWNTLSQSKHYQVEVRGQFASVVEENSVLSTHFSCDSWGTQIRIIKSKSQNFPQFINPISPNFYPCPASAPTFGWGMQPVCENMLIFGSLFWGGIPGEADIFPNEFRPVLMWPFDNQPHFSVSHPAIDGVSSEIIGSRFGSLGTPGNWNPNTPTNPLILDPPNSSSNTTIKGRFNDYDWPVLEAESSTGTNWPGGHSFQKTVLLMFRHSCPPTNQSESVSPTVQINFPWLQRFHSSSWIAGDDFTTYDEMVDGGCSSIMNEEIVELPVHLQDFEFTLSNNFPAGDIVLESETGTIPGFLLKFIWSSSNANCLDAPPAGVRHAWVRNTNPDDITINPTGGVVVGDPADQLFYMPGGVWRQGVSTGPLEFEIEYELNTCGSGTLNLEYGFVCHNMDESNNISFTVDENSCFTQTYTLDYSLVPTQYQMDFGTPVSVNGSPCDTYEFDVLLYSTNFGNVHDLLLDVTLSEDFDFNVVGIDLGGVACSYQPGSPNVTAGFATYSLDLSEECLNLGVLNLEQPVTVSFQVTGICDMLGEIHEILVSTSGNNFCGQELTSLVDDNNYIFTLDFTGQQDLSECDPECEIENYCLYIPNNSREDYGKSIITIDPSKFALAGTLESANENFYLAEFSANGEEIVGNNLMTGTISQSSSVRDLSFR